MFELLMLLCGAMLFLGVLLQKLPHSPRLRGLGLVLCYAGILVWIIGEVYILTIKESIDARVLSVLVVSAPLAATLIARAVNWQRAGALFMRLGPSRLAILWWLSMLFGAGLLIALVTANWNRTSPIMLLLGVTAILFVINPFIMQFDQPEFRENGFLKGEEFTSWNEVVSCTWNAGGGSTIVVDLILEGQDDNVICVAIPLSERIRLSDFLTTHIPQPAFAS